MTRREDERDLLETVSRLAAADALTLPNAICALGGMMAVIVGAHKREDAIRAWAEESLLNEPTWHDAVLAILDAS